MISKIVYNKHRKLLKELIEEIKSYEFLMKQPDYKEEVDRIRITEDLLSKMRTAIFLAYLNGFKDHEMFLPKELRADSTVPMPAETIKPIPLPNTQEEEKPKENQTTLIFN
jgi:hypothetical protein